MKGVTIVKISEVISNVEIWGLEAAVRCSKYPMLANVSDCTSDIIPRTAKLAAAPAGSGHDNFLKGIVVWFDLTFTIKAWTEAERYHFFEIISSQSTMHRINKMDYDACMIKYVTENTKNELKRLQKIYNETQDPEDYLVLLYNAPVGLQLTAGMVTNYQQLKTIYFQRRNHRLPEWKAFCEWCESLPYFREWIVDAQKAVMQ